jgi:hypothetical protein
MSIRYLAAILLEEEEQVFAGFYKRIRILVL